MPSKEVHPILLTPVAFSSIRSYATGGQKPLLRAIQFSCLPVYAMILLRSIYTFVCLNLHIDTYTIAIFSRLDLTTARIFPGNSRVHDSASLQAKTQTRKI
ncbi:hypothetical protein VCUG_01351 [Vavraia culicis subsp. floridensis]|uniref:Uncharacterized protein n=1 Tax=Vavraia culicis (isolate floridensis) TaxID=948595 RepID=L2GUV5_VAVCU|nr:uncharacterized protein VCUG_01351 [Vavraia culicis subsp. floridensis]ELA47162.1 hypothetical protein VCUG_01351 [Vavraia culicis subsp. floridensis]